MPKWVPSALISSIHGSLHGTSFRRCFKGFFSSPRGNPADPRTPRQAGIRRWFSYLAPRWYALTTAQREGWDDYGGNYTPRLTGVATFMKLNLRLLAASYSSLVMTCTAPTEPETPLHLENLRTFQISASANAIGWRAPSDPALFVSLYQSVEPGFSFQGKRRWSLVETQPTHHGQIIHTHGQPEDIRIAYRIKITNTDGRQPPPTEVSQPYDTPSVYVCDQFPDRVKEYGVPALDIRDLFDAWPGLPTEYKEPMGIAVDDYYIYAAFYVDLELAIFNRFNWQHVKTVATATQARYIAVDDTHVFVTFPFADKVEKRLKSDLSYVDEYIPGPGIAVAGVHVDDTYLWLTIPTTSALHRLTKSDMAFVDSYGSPGSGDAQFNAPDGICGDHDYLYVADRANDRIKKHRKSDWAFIAKIGSTGTGDDQFDWPSGIAQAQNWVIVSDHQNDRIKVHLKSDLSFVSKAGDTGYNREQFTRPIGINTLP
jgi:hypothetical protein